jgi:serine/threonine-protein kinase
MNDRLLNYPVPPRELNPEITPQLQEIIYRAIERDPSNRYARARDFASDLEHQDLVGVSEDRRELHTWQHRRSPLYKKVLFYVLLAMIPVAVFALLLYVAKHA